MDGAEDDSDDTPLFASYSLMLNLAGCGEKIREMQDEVAVIPEVA
jgi:hypothetical protein